MILCPNCLHKELTGALFCSECGAQLVFNEGIPTSDINTASAQEAAADAIREQATDLETQTFTGLPENIRLTLNLINTGEVLNLGSRSEYTLGRVSEGQPIIPDIDLSPYKAYDAGVSRMHISIKIKNQVTVTDLGSANGTRINGRRIAPHMPYPLKHGDILTLGKFKIQVLFQTR
jgi:pSer/pThr/pTyr-binding forkhead associated (FHA) protein